MSKKDDILYDCVLLLISIYGIVYNDNDPSKNQSNHLVSAHLGIILLGQITLSIFNTILQIRSQNLSYIIFYPTRYSLLIYLTLELSYTFLGLFTLYIFQAKFQ